MPARVFISCLRRLVLVGLGLLLGPGGGERAASAQTPPGPPAFPAGVELITVDAVVLDAHGRPVSGLTRDDFTVTEDDRPQAIVSFEAFTGEPVEEVSGPPSAVSSNEAGSPRSGRAFVILLDDLRIAPPRSEYARQAAQSFLERSVRDGDEVTLGTSSGDAWWSARIPEGREDLLAVLGRVKGRYVQSTSLDRMTEYEAFWIDHYEDSPAHDPLRPDRPGSAPPATDASGDPNPVGASVKERVKQRWKDANLCTGTSCDGMVRARAADIDSQQEARTRVTLQAVRRGLEAVATVRGRKSLLLLSEGFVDDPDASQRGVVAASREANAAVYFVDVRGLVALSVGSAGDPEQFTSPRDRATSAFQDRVLESAGAQALAEDTGGFSVKNTNDLAMGAERIAAESRVFYLLGLHPLPGKSARDWRKLRVDVKRPGLKVRARRGYTLGEGAETAKSAKKEGKKEGRKDSRDIALDPAVLRALDSAHDATGIPLRAIAYVFEPLPKDATRVLVAAEFDAGGLPAPVKGRGQDGKLDLSIVTTHRDSGREFRFDEVLGLGGAEGPAPGWRSVVRELDLPPGVAQVRVVVRDPASGAVGSVSQRFEVPPGGALRLSTPILTDRVEPAASAQARPRPALSAHRVFEPAGGLYLQFEVFGAARSPREASPKVSAGLTLRTHDGRIVRNAPPSPIVADQDGRVVRFVGIGLDGLEEGLYDLSLDVRDGVSGDRLEHHEPFTLAREAASR